MPLRLEVKKELIARSERVKCVDIHPTEPWVLSCLYDGTMHIYNYATESVVKSFEVSDQPIRCGAFIPRKQWIICGCDDMFIRVYNYNTMEKLKTFEAHMDYIRSMSVHPTLPLVVTASDDMLIKLWDWERGWANTMVFEGHAHYVMQVLFNPKDPNTFASASLDHTVKVWNIRSPMPNLTLEGHEKGVNCIDYYAGADKPYLVSGGDDQLVKIWDYQTRNCVQTLAYHQHNVSCVSFIHDRPLILSGSEDEVAVLWNSNTYRNEEVLQFNLGRCWAVSHTKGLNRIALGYDLGSVVIKLGKDTPLVSMDSSGKVTYIKQTEVSTVNVRTVDSSMMQDGERIPLASKELGHTENYPQSIVHSPNGRFIAVCGDGEYVIYTALAWRNKSFGQADEIVWDSSVGEYATRRGSSDIRVFSKTFKERQAIQPGFSAEGIFGGNMLTVKSSDFVCFFDWESLQLVRRIDVVPTKIYWSDSDLLALVTEQSFYILKFDRAALDAHLDANNGSVGPDGVEEAFQLLNEFSEKVITGCWVGDCFIYTNSTNRLNYVVGNDISLLHHLDSQQFILGYLVKENRVFLADKDVNIVSYKLNLSVLEYKTAVVRGDMETANSVLEKVPRPEHNKLAKFLESQNMREEALSLATDADYRCELAIALGKLDLAADIARETPSKPKWKQLSELAVQEGRLDLAEESLQEASDLSGLLTLASVKASPETLGSVAQESVNLNVMNVAFLSNFMLGNIEKCLEILTSSNRYPEAALFARSYCPSQVTRVVDSWRNDLRKSGNVRMADVLADPDNHPHLFEGFEYSTGVEEKAKNEIQRLKSESSRAYPKLKDHLVANFESLMKEEPVENGKDESMYTKHTNGVAEDDEVPEAEVLAEDGGRAEGDDFGPVKDEQPANGGKAEEGVPAGYEEDEA
mmetsp:Transcript_1616/g.4851  ORF Transcript_1616/g.4851 Transcript_1616/m.4851 type:complete len:916 (+) Transcript_1616:266-3013(+)|eukprot:CAMPEP_0198732540 /NCGR_PEP_ID=MMETSP1475-20131203/36515_1 /TAXON_ID= ORGANISM="Unidentified sp., Strain CCMP1999" /NCGR_SAMPLE_ID=MMETSP1475 /ASSEMBLY_ACC=CAM_ASM_001111 /LENGTH=915 /DNA_ID=CAMNT_0044495677 /DNA_START=258 /DNA_END=3005 /DNA_ORIENTATION=-